MRHFFSLLCYAMLCFLLRLGCTERLRHTFNAELAAVDVHDRHSRNFPYFSLEIFVAGGHDVTAMLLTPGNAIKKLIETEHYCLYITQI